ncbi:inner membrane protein [Sphingomonas sp. BE123]|uniref:metal-dependent hydrolase n=1 Tax=Sphingomonas sp. BE123 TaxID=2817842 RepID=UPI00286718F3|nr:metal-dependent hydrolase [Sphingomonas sp. BE123]MDR6851174.1 inner membrane protein [Sphingomonas sp. BE123]
MDNLTHSMIGAALGQAGLKKLSGLGMPTLIIAANIPDLDAACTFYGTQSLAMRRGLTHGPIAMLVLPVLLTAIMVGFDRWQARRGKRPEARAPVRPWHLLLLAFIGTLSHPAFDWLNSYGIRLLEPFSSRWFYGDSIFIIDIWMWAMLIGGFLWSRRAERRGGDWRRRGGIVVATVSVYILGNGVLTGLAETQTAARVRADHGIVPELVVANPVPIAFWQREILWRGAGQRGRRVINLAEGALPTIFPLEVEAPAPIGMDDPRIAAAAARDPNVRAFLFWSRMPFAERKPDGSLMIWDQRFGHDVARGQFSARIPAEGDGQ